MKTEGLRRQAIIAEETMHYLKRDFGKYAKGAFGMWAVFGTHFEQGDACRSTYYFFRHLDDILDKDRSIKGNPLTYAADIKSCIEQDNFDLKRFPILSLAKKSLDHLNNVKKPEDNPKGEMLQLIDSMMFDNIRMQKRMALPSEDIQESYRKQFNPIINLQLMSLNSKIRVGDIPSFPVLQGRIYALIDMKSDWEKGLINIPQEVLLEAGLDTNSDFNIVKESPVVRNWMQNERAECGKILAGENIKIINNLSKEPVAGTIFAALIDKMLKYAAALNNGKANSENPVQQRLRLQCECETILSKQNFEAKDYISFIDNMLILWKEDNGGKKGKEKELDIEICNMLGIREIRLVKREGTPGKWERASVETIHYVDINGKGLKPYLDIYADTPPQLEIRYDSLITGNPELMHLPKAISGRIALSNEEVQLICKKVYNGYLPV